MSAPNVSVIVSLSDKLTAPLRAVSARISALTGRMSRSFDQRGVTSVAAGSRRLASGLGDVIRQSRGAALAIAGYGAGLTALSFKFLGPAAEMERFKVQLTNLEGGAEGAKKAMAWIQEFATRTPLELNDTVAAYARLKAFGLDPTNGSLQALVDTMAATGGGAEQLDGLVLALGQAWTKGKLQGEEALQMLERGVPVWDLLAAKMGKTGAQVQDLATKGKLGRKELTLLIDALAERNKGASGNMAKTWDGIISNLMDHWTRFQVMVMDSGVFDYLKSRLQKFLALLDQMAADGRLQLWADGLAKAMLTALQTMWQVGESALALWQEWEPVLTRGVTMIGGWKNAAIALFAVMSANTILGIAGSLARVVAGVWQVGYGLARLSAAPLTALGNVAIFAAKIGMRALVVGLSAVRMAISAVGRAMLANPIGLAVTAIAGGAYLIYRNWDSIGPWFGRLFGNMRTISAGLLQFFKGVFTGDMSAAVAGLKGVWGGLKGFFGTLWDGVSGVFRAAWDNVIKPITDKLGITDEIVRGWNVARDALQAVLSAIGGFFNNAWTGYIKPAIDGLFSIGGVGAVWEGIKGAIGAVLDWLSAKFSAAWGVISPIIDGLKWAKDKGAEAVAALQGGGSVLDKPGIGTGGLPARPETGAERAIRQRATGPSAIERIGGGVPVTARAQGGSYTPGPLLVGERGPELRYETRGGFIAHNNDLRRMAALGERVSASTRGLHPAERAAIPAARPSLTRQAAAAAIMMLPVAAAAGQITGNLDMIRVPAAAPGIAAPTVPAVKPLAGGAQGGSYSPGPLLVGERGPELRYETRGGFIAHNNDLRRMAALGERVTASTRKAPIHEPRSTSGLRPIPSGQAAAAAIMLPVTVAAGQIAGNLDVIRVPAAVPGIAAPAVPAVKPLAARAQGGSYSPGPLLVGERGPELRYETRGGFIAHNNDLRRMAALGERVSASTRRLHPAERAAIPAARPSLTRQAAAAAMRMLPVAAAAGQITGNLDMIRVPAAAPGIAAPTVPAVKPLAARAQGGSYSPGPLLVGERGPELRYETRGGFIAHNNALRGLDAVTDRARAIANDTSGAAAAGSSAIPVPAPQAGAVRQVNYAPAYNIVINGSGLTEAELRRAIRAEMQANDRRAQADLRGYLHD